MVKKLSTKFFQGKKKTTVSDKFAGLELSFIGSDGHKYYSFKPDSSLPLARFSEQLMLLEHLRAGLLGDEISALMDLIDGANVDYLKAKDKEKIRHSARIGAYTSLVRSRTSNILHHKLLLRMATVWLVREDENPATINKEIAAEKELFFASECENANAYFFFQKTGFKGLQAFITLSENEFQELWNHSIQSTEALAMMTETLTQEFLLAK